MLTTTPPPNGRGCGDRDEESPYVCCGLDKDGTPIEEFIIDPAIPWPGKFQRGVKILPRNPQDPTGLQDLVIFVGKQHYPSAWSFIEETRRFGASRKVPPNLPFEKLTPGQSRMIFVHSRAIPAFDYELNRPAEPLAGCSQYEQWKQSPDTYNGEPPEKHREETPCTYGLRDLSIYLHADTEPLEDDPEYYAVIMPSFIYEVKYPLLPPYRTTTKWLDWQVGVFLALPLGHIEFVKKPHRQAQERAEKAGFTTVVMEE